MKLLFWRSAPSEEADDTVIDFPSPPPPPRDQKALTCADTAMREFENEWKNGDRDLARAMALDYVRAHPELEERYTSMDVEQLVKRLEFHRSEDDYDNVYRIEAWLLTKFPPQRIIGSKVS